MNDLFDDELNLESLDLEEEEFEEEDKFKTTLFGYNKRTVMNHIASLEKTIDQMQSNLETQIKELINEKEGLSQEKKYLENEFQQVSDEKKAIEEELFSLNQEYQKISMILQEQKEFEDLNRDLQVQINELSENNQNLHRQLQEINDLFEMAKEQELVYAKEIKKLQEELDLKVDKIATLEDQVNKFDLKMEEKDAEIFELNEELEQAQKTKEHLQTELSQRIEEIETMNEQIDKQKEEISKLEEEKQYFLKQKEVSPQKDHESFVQDSIHLMNNLYETLPEENSIKFDLIREEIESIHQQLQFLELKGFEEMQQYRSQLDAKIAPLIKRIEKLESKESDVAHNAQAKNYQSLMDRFMRTDDPEEISDLYREINQPRKRNFSHSMIDQEQQLYRQELEKRLNSMYEKLAKNI
ncbi:MAG TPA: hypothetical protein VIG45_05410 [Erysipelothrix sp.]